MKVALEGTDIVPFPSAANINPGANPPAPKPTASSTSPQPDSHTNSIPHGHTDTLGVRDS